MGVLCSQCCEDEIPSAGSLQPMVRENHATAAPLPPPPAPLPTASRIVSRDFSAARSLAVQATVSDSSGATAEALELYKRAIAILLPMLSADASLSGNARSEVLRAVRGYMARAEQLEQQNAPTYDDPPAYTPRIPASVHRERSLYEVKSVHAAAKLRRDFLISQIAANEMALVRPSQLRFGMLTANGFSFTTLDNPSEPLAPSERDCEDLHRSEHFRRLCEHVRHKPQLVGLGPESPRVVYFAIMCDEVEVTVEDPRTKEVMHHRSAGAYVGKAKSGVRSRWVKDWNHHLAAANHISSVKMGGDHNTMLVDATMRVVCARGGVVWLFVVGQCAVGEALLNREEHQLIEHFGTVGSQGLNFKL